MPSYFASSFALVLIYLFTKKVLVTSQKSELCSHLKVTCVSAVDDAFQCLNHWYLQLHKMQKLLLWSCSVHLSVYQIWLVWLRDLFFLAVQIVRANRSKTSTPYLLLLDVCTVMESYFWKLWPYSNPVVSLLSD